MLSLSGEETRESSFGLQGLPEGKADEKEGCGSSEPRRLGSRLRGLVGLAGRSPESPPLEMERGHGCAGQTGAPPPSSVSGGTALGAPGPSLGGPDPESTGPPGELCVHLFMTSRK